MRWSAVIGSATLLFLAMPAVSAAQSPPAPAKSIEDQNTDLQARAATNRNAIDEAGARCDLVRYRSLIQELSEILNQSNRLLDASRTTPGSPYRNVRNTNDNIRRDYNYALERLTTLEERCRKPSTTGGDIGVVGSTTPATPQPAVPPPTGFSELWANAASAFQANYGFALNCDIGRMRSQQANLERFTREARDLASKLRQRAAKGKASQADANAATLYEKAIEALWNAARLQPPLNCPRIEPPPPPQPPKGGSQDCPAPGTPGGSAPGKTPPEHGMRFTPPDERSERMLAAHNRARADAGVPPLTWDRELAAGAADYAAQMSTIGRVHAPREGRKCIRENLLQSLPGGRTPEQMVGVWIGEKRNFVAGTFPDVSRTGNWSDVGHYTQVIWRSTARIGCAVHSDARYDWLVCRYSPPGNVDGRPVM